MLDQYAKVKNKWKYQVMRVKDHEKMERNFRETQHPEKEKYYHYQDLVIYLLH